MYNYKRILSCFMGKRTLLLLCLAVLLKCSICHPNQNDCRTEYGSITIKDEVRSIKWKVKNDVDHSIIISDPPCLDEKYNLIVRLCSNSSWVPSEIPLCSYIESNERCPRGFLAEGKKHCVYVTEPGADCPYPGAYFSEEKDDEDYRHRSKHSGGEKTINDLLFNPQSASNNKSLSCIYNHDYFLYQCPNDCVAGGLGTNYCFCKHFGSGSQNIDEYNCNNLASASSSYERERINKVSGRDTCLTAEFKNNSVLTHIVTANALHVAVNKNGWNLQANNNLSCSICKVDADAYGDVELELKYSSDSQKLHLTVYSANGLLTHDDKDVIHCYTDAAGNLKEEVEIDKKWDSYAVRGPKNGTQTKVYKVSMKSSGPGRYWCEAYQLPNVTLVESNKVVGAKKFKGHEYALRLVITDLCKYMIGNCSNPTLSNIYSIVKNEIHEILDDIVKNTRIMHVYNLNVFNETIDILLHLSTGKRSELLDDFYKLDSILRSAVFRYKPNINIVFFKSSEACLPEDTVIGNTTVHWKQTLIGRISTTDEICVQQDGIPVRRKCLGDFLFGSQWSDVEGNCSDDVEISSKTVLLHEYVSSDNLTIISKNISSITESPSDFSILDVYYLAQILQKMAPNVQNDSLTEVVDEVTAVINNMMKIDSTILQESQKILNSTDDILDSLENIFHEVSKSMINTSTAVFFLRKHNVIVQMTRPFLNNVSGFAIYGEDSNVSFLEFHVKNLYANTSFDQLSTDQTIEVAVYVPEELLQELSVNVTDEELSNIRIITAVFYNDSFFNSDVNETHRVGSKIVSVNIPGYGSFLQNPLPVIFRHSNKYQNKSCAFWDYGINSNTKSGHWSTKGGSYFENENSTVLESCTFSHLTHFALLVMNEKVMVMDDNSVIYDYPISKLHDDILSVINGVECFLSLFGIIGIFLTAAFFKTWREKVGNIILIQLSIAIILECILLYVASIDTLETKKYRATCIVVGIFLHYIVISKFCWMLVSAVMQFFRFVRVLGPMPVRIVLKSMLVGWGLPLIPVIFVLILDLDCYAPGAGNFCYPRGLSMYVGVLLPIGLIAAANMLIFVDVMYNIFSIKVDNNTNSRDNLKQQLLVTTLLAFLLGVPWIFGIFQEMLPSGTFIQLIFVYLFCLTATLQGFVLFLFYILFNKSTRLLWCTLIKSKFKVK